MAWATPRTWVTGDVATAAQFNQDMRDNLTYLYGGDGATLGSGPQYVWADGSKAAVPFNTFGTISFSTIFSTTYSSPASGTAVPLTEAGIYIVSGWIQSLPLTSVPSALGMRVALNGTVLQGMFMGYFVPFDLPASCDTKRLVKLAAAGTLSMLGVSIANSATSDMAGRLQAMRVA